MGLRGQKPLLLSTRPVLLHELLVRIQFLTYTRMSGRMPGMRRERRSDGSSQSTRHVRYHIPRIATRGAPALNPDLPFNHHERGVSTPKCHGTRLVYNMLGG